MFFFFPRYHGCRKPECWGPLGQNDPVQQERNAAFLKQVQLLQDEYGFLAENIFVKWEHDWLIERQTPKVAKYLRENPQRPLTRLKPQQAVKAALNESYVLHCNTSDSSSTSSGQLKASDVSSLFPFSALNLQVPYNRCHKFVGEEIVPAKVSFQEDAFYHNNKAVQGLLQVRVLPPQNLKYPFLLTSVKQQSLAVLCRTCAETMQQEACDHSEGQRSLTDVWTTAELCFAVSQLNYKILDIYEMMLYEESSPLLEKFTCLLGWHKVRSAPLPSWVDPNKP